MILRSGRAKTEVAPTQRHRLPTLRPLGEVRFSHTRHGAQFESVEVDVGAELARDPSFALQPGTYHRNDSGSIAPLSAPIWTVPESLNALDAKLTASVVKHGNRALRRFRRGNRHAAVKIAVSRVSAVVTTVARREGDDDAAIAWAEQGLDDELDATATTLVANLSGHPYHVQSAARRFSANMALRVPSRLPRPTWLYRRWLDSA